MYRRVVLSKTQPTNSSIIVLYHVYGARMLSQARVSTTGTSKGLANVAEIGAVIFPDAVRLQANASIEAHHEYEFNLYVSDNQPAEEAVEEITSTGVTISVYNEHGVLVCRKTPANSAPAQTVVSGEMTSEPIDGTGEMTSESIDATGEMTSEPIDDHNVTI